MKKRKKKKKNFSLKIPKKFVRIFGDELSNAAMLTVPNGRVWQVGLTKDRRKIWFQDGWYDFVQYHSIKTGYFLVFKYGKNSNFNVLIFDLTALRYNTPIMDEIENEDSAEIMDFTTPYLTFDSPKNKVFDKCPRSSSIMPSHPKFKHGYGSQNKRLKMEELVESSIKSNAIDIDIKLKKTAYKVGTHATDEPTKSDLEILQLTRERERAIATAKVFKPKYPSFMVISRSVDIRLRHLYVPAKFAHMYFNRNAKNIKVLDSEGRKWSVQLSRLPLCFITKLGGFAKELDDGDICVLCLLNGRNWKFQY
ncbi:hypothetical protein ACOSQ2_005689 [Xanthoceras sorbifolium]